MNKLLSLAAAIGMAAFIGGPAVAHDASPAHYHTGKVQPFVGLVCRTQAPAAHIFATWRNDGAEESRKVFQVYQSADECKFLRTYEAYFIEKIDSMKVKNFRGKMQAVLLFSIAPTKGSEIVDYLVTWENLPPTV